MGSHAEGAGEGVLREGVDDRARHVEPVPDLPDQPELHEACQRLAHSQLARINRDSEPRRRRAFEDAKRSAVAALSRRRPARSRLRHAVHRGGRRRRRGARAFAHFRRHVPDLLARARVLHPTRRLQLI